LSLLLKQTQEYQRILSLVISMIIIAAAYLSHSQAALGFLIVFGVASLGEHFLLYSSNVENSWTGKVDLMIKIIGLFYVLYKFVG